MIRRLPGSFRDPDSGVIEHEGEILRYLRGESNEGFRRLEEGGELAALIQSEQLLSYAPITNAATVAELSLFQPDARWIQHPKLHFISYPYEWSFGMLRDAALSQLDLLARVLRAGCILKDASPYNVQFIGARPVHIDLGSFVPYREELGWMAYNQFCRLFLNPLLLESSRGVAFNGWLRASPSGIEADAIRRLLPLSSKLRPAIFTNVVLQAWLQNRFATINPSDLGTRPGVPASSLLRQIERLRRLISSLRSGARESAWSSYVDELPYTPTAIRAKREIVERTLAKRRPTMVWDIGANSGEFSRIAAAYATTVIAFDSDPTVVDRHFASLRGQSGAITPMLVDFLNPSPNQGWGEQELAGVARRGPADFVLALAVLHHIRLSGNVPIAQFLAYLKQIARAGLVEYVPASDPTARRLVAWRQATFDDYEREQVEAAFRTVFSECERHELPESGRVLLEFTS